MYIEDVITIPLPAFAREPLLVVIDVQETRRALVARLLTFAHYQVYVPNTAGEALIWFMQTAGKFPSSRLLTCLGRDPPVNCLDVAPC